MTDAEYVQRFLSRSKHDGDCWLYGGKLQYNGYAQVLVRHKRYILHRWVYATMVGPIPAGLEVCHRCDVRNCFNPTHLFTATHQDNCKDMAAKKRHQNNKKTHCRRGHVFDQSYVCTQGWNHRRCSICERIRNRLKSGWPLDLAQSAPKVPFGYSVFKRLHFTTAGGRE